MDDLGFDDMNDENNLGSDFWYKAMPVLTAGFLIWFLTIFLFGLIVELLYIVMSILLVPLIISYFGLWIITYIFACNKNNTIAMGCFFTSSFITGIITAPILAVASFSLGTGIAIFLFITATVIGLGTTTGLMLMGMRLGEQITEKWGYPLAFFGLQLVLLDFSFIFLVGPNIIFLLISTAINALILAWLFGVILWDGSMLSGNILEGKWMVSVVDIFLDLINVILRIFEIMLQFAEAFS